MEASIQISTTDRKWPAHHWLIGIRYIEYVDLGFLMRHPDGLLMGCRVLRKNYPFPLTNLVYVLIQSIAQSLNLKPNGVVQ